LGRLRFRITSSRRGKRIMLKSPLVCLDEALPGNPIWKTYNQEPNQVADTLAKKEGCNLIQDLIWNKMPPDDVVSLLAFHVSELYSIPTCVWFSLMLTEKKKKKKKE
jgi:hypothetical protein